MKHYCFGENLGKLRVCGSGGSIVEVRFETDNDQNCPTKHFAFLNIPERDEKKQRSYYSTFYFQDARGEV